MVWAILQRLAIVIYGTNFLAASAWENCDFRSYEFAGDDSDDNATIVETHVSRVARGVADQKIPTKEEQHAYYLQTMEMWERKGFQNPLKLNEVFGT